MIFKFDFVFEMRGFTGVVCNVKETKDKMYLYVRRRNFTHSGRLFINAFQKFIDLRCLCENGFANITSRKQNYKRVSWYLFVNIYWWWVYYPINEYRSIEIWACRYKMFGWFFFLLFLGGSIYLKLFVNLGEKVA